MNIQLSTDILDSGIEPQTGNTSISQTQITEKKLTFFEKIRNFRNELRLSKSPRLSAFQKEMQLKAGIVPTSVCRVFIGDGMSLDMSEYPTVMQYLKFKICGFRYIILKDKIS